MADGIWDSLANGNRRPRRRFSAGEKARIVGLFQHFLAEASAFQARSPPTVVTPTRESHRPTGRCHLSKAFLNTHLHSPSSCRRAHHFLTFLRWPLSVCESARPGFSQYPNYLFLAESTPLHVLLLLWSRTPVMSRPPFGVQAKKLDDRERIVSIRLSVQLCSEFTN